MTKQMLLWKALEGVIKHRYKRDTGNAIGARCSITNLGVPELKSKKVGGLCVSMDETTENERAV